MGKVVRRAATAGTATGTEKPDRLAIGTEVSRELWLLTGNECAWPSCGERLLNDNNDWVGEIAHIRGVKPGSARFDPAMTNEERRAYENLMLVCPTHHARIDGTAGRSVHTREELEEIKHNHEDRFRRVIAVIAETEEQYLDLTTRNTARHARTLAGLLPDMDDEGREWCLGLVRPLADTLGRTTLAARQLAATVVEFEEQIAVPEAARRAGTTRERIYDLIIELERFELAYVEDGFPGELQQRIVLSSGVLDGWDFWSELRAYTEKHDGITLQDVIVNLDFALLD